MLRVATMEAIRGRATPGAAQDGARRQADAQLPRVVILGAGFGGLNAALALARAPVDVTVIDQRNHHLFQPLLYQVATAGLSPAQIATPIRRILSGQRNASVLMDRVEGIDTASKVVRTTHRQIAYDYLIVATGARHAYFGRDDWAEAAPGLKTVSDATAIRGRILSAFEQAELVEDEDRRHALLTFVVIGGGPTGVELAGAIAELARRALSRDFRRIDPTRTRVILVEAGERLLVTFPPRLAEKARQQLEQLGVEVMTGHAVTRCDQTGVALADGRAIEAGTVLWAAGVMASGAGRWLDVPTDRVGRVVVDEHLRVRGRDGVYVIGDTASVKDTGGQPVPGVAPAAKQMGRYVARAIRASLATKSVGPFRYRSFGNLATIGRKAAVADLGGIRLSGMTAWLIWSLAHVWFLIGFRNRIVVALDWAWAYATFDRGARLITGRGR